MKSHGGGGVGVPRRDTSHYAPEPPRYNNRTGANSDVSQTGTLKRVWISRTLNYQRRKVSPSSRSNQQKTDWSFFFFVCFCKASTKKGRGERDAEIANQAIRKCEIISTKTRLIIDKLFFFFFFFLHFLLQDITFGKLYPLPVCHTHTHQLRLPFHLAQDIVFIIIPFVSVILRHTKTMGFSDSSATLVLIPFFLWLP